MFIDVVAGARPNFVKVAPILRALDAFHSDLAYRFVHTGQHTTDALSAEMLRDLGLPEPAVELQATGPTPAELLGNIISAYGRVLRIDPPVAVVVVGDVTSTLGAALAAKAVGCAVVHVEAGLRSGDRRMPEELNRIAVDGISDLLLTTVRSADAALAREGVPSHRVRFVGNPMVDSLLAWKATGIERTVTTEMPKAYCLLTLHRPENVDDPGFLQQQIDRVCSAAVGLPVVFPVHPRTAQQLPAQDMLPSNLLTLAPLSYRRFLEVLSGAQVVITDSGGVCEECVVLQKRCITLRETTERPETIESGWNALVRKDDDLEAAWRASGAMPVAGSLPEGWDGEASERIAHEVVRFVQTLR